MYSHANRSLGDANPLITDLVSMRVFWLGIPSCNDTWLPSCIALVGKFNIQHPHSYIALVDVLAWALTQGTMNSRASRYTSAEIVDVAGKDIYGEGYRAVMAEMLTQGNSYSHVPARRTVWLKAMQPLFQVQFQCVSVFIATAGFPCLHVRDWEEAVAVKQHSIVIAFHHTSAILDHQAQPAGCLVMLRRL